MLGRAYVVVTDIYKNPCAKAYSICSALLYTLAGNLDCESFNAARNAVCHESLQLVRFRCGVLRFAVCKPVERFNGRYKSARLLIDRIVIFVQYALDE